MVVRSIVIVKGYLQILPFYLNMFDICRLSKVMQDFSVPYQLISIFISFSLDIYNIWSNLLCYYMLC